MQNESLVARVFRFSTQSSVFIRVHLWLVFFLFCVFAFDLHAQKQVAPPPETLSPEEAAKQGRALVDEILEQKPSENTTNTGVMTIRDAKGKRTKVPIKFSVFATPTSWSSTYETEAGSPYAITVIHDDSRPNQYQPHAPDAKFTSLSGNQIMSPFAGSDFWIADLGLEFFHWPDQRVTKKEMKRSRACQVLESINPSPGPGTYSRVKSWIDNESHGILMAEAYDSQGKLLKQFIPKHVEKVQGQWQVQEMEIDNAQTGSSTRVDFNLDAPQ